MKTNTARCCPGDVAKLVGPSSGDWAVASTIVTLEDGSPLPMWCLGHRRGPAVHTFLMTCGTTELGAPQAHKDDDLDVDGLLINRKCPKVLNDATCAQPKIDMNNKKRQFELAIERRFRTRSFPFRLFTTVLGTCFVDAYYAHNYLNNRDKIDWASACRQQWWCLIHNNWDEIEAGTKDADDLFVGQKQETTEAKRKE